MSTIQVFEHFREQWYIYYSRNFPSKTTRRKKRETAESCRKQQFLFMLYYSDKTFSSTPPSLSRPSQGDRYSFSKHRLQRDTETRKEFEFIPSAWCGGSKITLPRFVGGPRKDARSLGERRMSKDCGLEQVKRRRSSSEQTPVTYGGKHARNREL